VELAFTIAVAPIPTRASRERRRPFQLSFRQVGAVTAKARIIRELTPGDRIVSDAEKATLAEIAAALNSPPPTTAGM
jgi:hypothetical protein